MRLPKHILLISRERYITFQLHFIMLSTLKKSFPKDFNNAKKHFLWFGSSGMIHKGLDLLLDIFSKREEIHLHICGPLEGNQSFNKLFTMSYLKPNIHYHGFVSINSTLFKEAAAKMRFCYFPFMF